MNWVLASWPTRRWGAGFSPAASGGPDDLDKSDWRPGHPRFEGDNLAANVRLADAVAALAEAKGCTAAQLCLAWVLAQGEDVVPIPGTKRVKYLEENVGALDLRLSETELEQLDEMFPPGSAAGTRYPAAAMQNLGL